MSEAADYWACVAIGVGATTLTDIWVLFRHRLFGVSLPDYGLVGRWFAYLPRGRFRHERIGATPAVRGERAIGWTAHYLIGIAYAGLLIFFDNWLRHPTLGPALIVGIGTVTAPFLLMQPGMGAGIAASRSPTPWTARMHSLVMHTVFGLGLYAVGLLTSYVRFQT